MKIYIKEHDKKVPISFTIPNSLLFGRLTKKLIAVAIHNSVDSLSEYEYIQIIKMLDAFSETIKQYGHFELVDVEAADGTIVKISF